MALPFSGATGHAAHMATLASAVSNKHFLPLSLDLLRHKNLLSSWVLKILQYSRMLSKKMSQFS